MKLSRSKIIKAAVVVVLFICMLFANFYAVRKMMQYGMELYFYDKLQVAYNIGGMKGLKEELTKMSTTDKMPRELPLIKSFEARLYTLNDPGVFLSSKVDENKKRINLIRNLRSAVIVFMLFIFTWRLIANLCRNRKERLFFC